MFVYIFVLLFASAHCLRADPNYYTDQLVDHFSSSDMTYSQRYYKVDTYFITGSPIFVIMGGEGAIPPEVGIFYPFIVQLAQEFNALVVEPEHRFYGESQPISPFSTDNLQLLTPQQALADAAQFIEYIKMKYNSPQSLVFTIGGSYPGWLSAMMRIRYPAVVDFAYAASAPMYFYSQDVNQYDYYKVVSASAEQASTGCFAAVQKMLGQTLNISTSKNDIVQRLQLCTPLPDYIQQQPITTLINEISMVVMYSFANLNMANYPPPNTSLTTACKQIQAAVGAGNYWGALQAFLNGYSDDLVTTTLQKISRKNSHQQCYNLSLQLPAGHDATISAGDWSGVGTGADGASWDFQTSTFLVEAIGTNGQTDMFLPREWTIDWLTQHAQARFKTTPHPHMLADLWGFQNLKKIGVTHIIFTNGLKDGWSVGGIKDSILENEIYALSMPNGAHHSDLLHEIISNDTPDVMQVRNFVEHTLRKWLDSAKNKLMAHQ